MDENAIDKTHDLVEQLNTAFDDEDVLSENECFRKEGPVLPLLKKIVEYYEKDDNKKKEVVSLYNDIATFAEMVADFDTGSQYAKKCVKLSESIQDPMLISDAYYSCSNCLLSAALSIAATALDLIYSSDEKEHEVDIPDELKEKCEAYTAEAVDYFHQTYILNLKLAIEAAAKLKLVDGDLVNKLDDENITATVETLTKALDETNTESEEYTPILDYLMTATDMNKKVVLPSPFDS